MMGKKYKVINITLTKEDLAFIKRWNHCAPTRLRGLTPKHFKSLYPDLARLVEQAFLPIYTKGDDNKFYKYEYQLFLYGSLNEDKILEAIHKFGNDGWEVFSLDKDTKMQMASIWMRRKSNVTVDITTFGFEKVSKEVGKHGRKIKTKKRI